LYHAPYKRLIYSRVSKTLQAQTTFLGEDKYVEALKEYLSAGK